MNGPGLAKPAITSVDDRETELKERSWDLCLKVGLSLNGKAGAPQSLGALLVICRRIADLHTEKEEGGTSDG